MNPTTAVVGTGVLMLAGTFAEDKKFDAKKVVALGFIAMMLAVFNEANPKLTGQFSLLLLVAAMFRYGPAIFKGLKL